MHPRVQQLVATHPTPWALRTDSLGDLELLDAEGDLVSSYELDDTAFAAGVCEALNEAATAGPFLSDVRQLVLGAPAAARVVSLGQAWLVLGDAMATLRIEIELPAETRSITSAREQLVRLAAVAWMAARDLGIEAKGEAIGKDIPF